MYAARPVRDEPFGAGVKVVNVRAHWVREGMLLTTLPANTAMTSDEMQAYYSGIRYGTVGHKQLRKPRFFPRIVLLTADSRFLLIPMTPDIVIVPVKEET